MVDQRMATASEMKARARGWFRKLADRASPTWVTFGASLLLSWMSIYGGTLNRDGMLYVDTARMFLEQGFDKAIATYFWPFLPILMAYFSKVSGLGLEASGYLINALFMAGTCSLLVASSTRLFPEAVWYVCLVVLALPGFNEYRDELLREYGCWFFVMLSFWLAIRWSAQPRWLGALTLQASLGVAALFRPEALAFFPALIFWQCLDAPAAERRLRLVMIGALPLLGLAVLISLFVTGNLGAERLAADLGRLSLERFNAKALAMAPAFIEYARDQARTVLFFGSLAIIPLKFVIKMSVFIIPLAYAFTVQSMRALLGRAPLFAWAFLTHALVLGVFVVDMQFLAGRYLGVLLAFAAPFTGYGIRLFLRGFPRASLPIVVMSILIAMSNVVSLAPAKLHHVEAGAWLAANVQESPRIYVESGRSAYYAGWQYATRPTMDREHLKDALIRGEYDLVVLEVSRKEPDISSWLESAGLVEVRRFVHPNHDAVIVAKPKQRR